MAAREEILAALKKLGPAGRKAIADHIGVSGPTAGAHLQKALAAGDIKSTGKGRGLVFALPDQEFSAPTGATQAPPKKKPKQAGKKKGGRKAKKPRKDKNPRAPSAPESDFTPAVTVDARLVIIEDGAVRTFSAKQTSAIADLVLAQFST